MMASITAFLLILLAASLVWDSLIITISEKERKEQMQMLGERAMDFLSVPNSPITSGRYALDGGKLAFLDSQKNNFSYADSFKNSLGVPAYNLTVEIGLPSPIAFPNSSYSSASSRSVASRPFLYGGSYVQVRAVVWK